MNKNRIIGALLFLTFLAFLGCSNREKKENWIRHLSNKMRNILKF